MENCIFWEACGMSVSEAQKKASVKYLEKLDEVRVRAEKGTKNRWKNAAASRGKSLNQFVMDAVEHEISVGTGKDSEAE